MATFNAPGVTNTVQRAGITGNVCSAIASITGDGNGGTVASGSVLNMIKLPAFCRVLDVRINPSLATSSLTAEVGYAPVDGSTASVDEFITSGALATTAFVRSNNPASPTTYLQQDSYVTVTTGGATSLATNVISLLVIYEYVGR